MANMYLESQKFDIKVNIENPLDELKQILMKLKPAWKKEHMKFDLLRNGLLNQSYSCYTDKDTEKKDAVVVKLIKDMGSASICPKDEEREFHNWTQLNKHKVGVPLLARFQNGIVMKSVAGSLLDMEASNDPHIAKLVAEELAKFHDASFGTDLYVDGSADPEDLNFLEALAKKCIKQLKEFTVKGEHADLLLQFISAEEMEQEYTAMKEHLKHLDMELVICHNDCWRENILYDTKSDTLTIIDYEGLDRNYAPFDLGIYLSTCADNPPEIEKRPSEEFSKDFVKSYLVKRYELRGKTGQNITQDEIDKYYKHACLCMSQRSFYIAAIGLYFGAMDKNPLGMHITLGFYQFYLDSKSLYWPKQ